MAHIRKRATINGSKAYCYVNHNETIILTTQGNLHGLEVTADQFGNITVKKYCKTERRVSKYDTKTTITDSHLKNDGDE